MNQNPQFAVSRSSLVNVNAKWAFIRYKFITDEVTGGFCGNPQWNDNFIIYISTPAGSGGTFTNFHGSMNELGCNAFDANGETNWYILWLNLKDHPTGVDIQFEVQVANVGDQLFQSIICGEPGLLV